MTSATGTALRLIMLLAASVVSAMEIFEDEPDPEQFDQMFQTDNYIDSPISYSDGFGSDMSADPLFAKLFNLPHTGKLFNFPYRSRWITPDLDNVGHLMPKRMLEVDAAGEADKRAAVAPPRKAPQPKTRRRGIHMVCFLKLCSFRRQK